MASIGQYLKDTRSELRHVAWPTRAQTIAFTTLVIGISLALALYLGFFDFVFSQGLSKILGGVPTAQNPVQVQQVATGTVPANNESPVFNVTGH